MSRAVADKGINIRIDAAAEYFLDDHFDGLLQKDDIFTLPEGFVLLEMPFVGGILIYINMQLKGYKPILELPERYPTSVNTCRPCKIWWMAAVACRSICSSC